MKLFRKNVVWPVVLSCYEHTHCYCPDLFLSSMPVISVFLSMCPDLFTSWKEFVPLEELSLWSGWELADCHLCVGGSSQDAGSSLGCGYMTQYCVLSAMQTRPVALLLSVWEASGDTCVLVTLWGGAKTLLRPRLWASPVDHLSQHGRVSV